MRQCKEVLQEETLETKLDAESVGAVSMEGNQLGKGKRQDSLVENRDKQWEPTHVCDSLRMWMYAVQVRKLQRHHQS